MTASLVRGKIKDFGLNIISAVLLTAATQLLAYPYLSRVMSVEEYGLLLTLMGIVNTIGVGFGNPLCNTRVLIQGKEGDAAGEGDFNPILFALTLISAVIGWLSVSLVVGRVTAISFVCAVISVLVLHRSYYIASYRINLTFEKNVYMSIAGCAGYLLGIGATWVTGFWPFTFLLGEAGSYVYLLATSEIVRDRFSITKNFKNVLAKYSALFVAAVLITVMTYADRFVVSPLLGMEFVSVYVVSSYLGKMLGVVINPISSVLLSYYAKEDDISLGLLYKRIAIMSGVCVICFAMVEFVQVPVTSILFPTIAESSLPYLTISNAGAIALCCGNTIQPILLKYCPDIVQPILQVAYIAAYAVCALLGLSWFGFYGFCIGVLVANILRCILFVIVSHLFVRNLGSR